MSGKLMFGGLAAVAVMALSADTASAQYVVRHGNHYHNVSPGYGYGYSPVIYQPVVTAPIYTRPVVYGGFPSYGYGGGFGGPVYGGGFGGPVYGGGYGRPVYGGSFNTVNFGIYRPGFNANFGFVIR